MKKLFNKYVLGSAAVGAIAGGLYYFKDAILGLFSSGAAAEVVIEAAPMVEKFIIIPMGAIAAVPAGVIIGGVVAMIGLMGLAYFIAKRVDEKKEEIHAAAKAKHAPLLHALNSRLSMKQEARKQNMGIGSVIQGAFSVA